MENSKYDSDEFDERPSCLDAAYEREAILSGLLGRQQAVFPENRPSRPLYTSYERRKPTKPAGTP